MGGGSSSSEGSSSCEGSSSTEGSFRSEAAAALGRGGGPGQIAFSQLPDGAGGAADANVLSARPAPGLPPSVRPLVTSPLPRRRQPVVHSPAASGDWRPSGGSAFPEPMAYGPSLPEVIWGLTALQKLDLTECFALENLPEGIVGLNSFLITLMTLRARPCCSLE